MGACFCKEKTSKSGTSGIHKTRSGTVTTIKRGGSSFEEFVEEDKPPQLKKDGESRDDDFDLSSLASAYTYVYEITKSEAERIDKDRRSRRLAKEIMGIDPDLDLGQDAPPKNHQKRRRMIAPPSPTGLIIGGGSSSVDNHV